MRRKRRVSCRVSCLIPARNTRRVLPSAQFGGGVLSFLWRNQPKRIGYPYFPMEIHCLPLSFYYMQPPDCTASQEISAPDSRELVELTGKPTLRMLFTHDKYVYLRSPGALVSPMWYHPPGQSSKTGAKRLYIYIYI